MTVLAKVSYVVSHLFLLKKVSSQLAHSDKQLQIGYNVGLIGYEKMNPYIINI